MKSRLLSLSLCMICLIGCMQSFAQPSAPEYLFYPEKAIESYRPSLENVSEGITLIEPSNGSTVQLLPNAQRKFVLLTQEERIRQYVSKDVRMGLRKASDKYPVVALKWKNAMKDATAVRVVVSEKPTFEDAVVVEPDSDTPDAVVLHNLKVGMTYYWKVLVTTADGSSFGSKTASFTTEDVKPRVMKIDGVHNARDLGGYVGLNGRRVRQGMIYRTATMNGAPRGVYCTPEELLEKFPEKAAKGNAIQAEIKELEDKISAEADAKNKKKLSEELKAKKKELDATIKVRKDELPGKVLLPDAMKLYMGERLGIKSDLDLRNASETKFMTGSPIGETTVWRHHGIGSYQLPKNPNNGIIQFFKVFLNKEHYPIVFHCMAGQDRTGTGAFILGALLGLSENDLYLDWEVTAFKNYSISFNHDKYFNKLIALINGYPGDTMQQKVENYMMAIGFTQEDFETFRDIMLE